MLASVGVKALGEVTHLFQIPAMVFQIETIYKKKERMGKISNSIKKLSVILSVSVASQRSTSHGQAFFFLLKKALDFNYSLLFILPRINVLPRLLLDVLSHSHFFFCSSI